MPLSRGCKRSPFGAFGVAFISPARMGRERAALAVCEPGLLELSHPAMSAGVRVWT